MTIFSDDEAKELLYSEIDDQEPTTTEINAVGGAAAAKWFEFTPIELKEPRIEIERVEKGIAVGHIAFAEDEGDSGL